VTVLKFCR